MKLEDAEARRDAALGVTGVNYDSRSNRYTVDIMRDGRKQRVGSFHTVEEAAAAYREKRASFAPAQPGRRSEDRGPTVAQSYADFLKVNPSPKIGDTWITPDGQEFYFLQTFFQRKGNDRVFFHKFDSVCRTPDCGRMFETSAAAYAPHMVGITRNCEDHRKASSFGRKGTGKTTQGRGAKSATVAAASGKSEYSALNAPFPGHSPLYYELLRAKEARDKANALGVGDLV